MTKVYVRRSIGIAEIQIVIGDISNQPDIAAVVNASNPKLRMGSGVSGAIFRAAGVEALSNACTPLAPIAVGDAVITSGFGLPNSHIIHCCGPQYKEGSDENGNLGLCYWNILQLAEKNKIASLAIPAISTGAFGFPIEDATRICIDTIKETSPDFDNLKILRFVVPNENIAKIYSEALLENIPIPINAVKVDFEAFLSESQFQTIRRGFFGDQDSKWFFYYDEPWLYIFRGVRRKGEYTGFCYWYINFQPEVLGYKVAEAWIDESLHSSPNEDKDRLSSLIFDYLLHEDLFISLGESKSNSYRLLPSGKIIISICSEPVYLDEVKALGLQLIDLADTLSKKLTHENIPHLSDRFRGALIGLACGDAVGTTVEFRQRGTFPLVTDMVGGGPFKLKAGQWTDDTSMALCLAESLVECTGFNATDQMQRYLQWFDNGYWSSTGQCFDIGGTTHDAISKFRNSGEPFSGSTHAQSAGNGCIMRLAPIPMFFFPDRDAVIEMSGESSRTTHGAPECIEASRLFGAMIHLALSGASKDRILLGHGMSGFASEGIQAIATGEYRTKSEENINGIGYVVPSLEAALWCFYSTDNFCDAILKATNLGNDSDTTAAICGQLAGAFYGEAGIPQMWRSKLSRYNDICLLADKLFKHSSAT